MSMNHQEYVPHSGILIRKIKRCTLGIRRCRCIRLTLRESEVKRHGERPGRRSSHIWFQDTAFRAQAERCHTIAVIRIILEECDSQSTVPRPAASPGKLSEMQILNLKSTESETLGWDQRIFVLTSPLVILMPGQV